MINYDGLDELLKAIDDLELDENDEIVTPRDLILYLKSRNFIIVSDYGVEDGIRYLECKHTVYGDIYFIEATYDKKCKPYFYNIQKITKETR